MLIGKRQRALPRWIPWLHTARRDAAHSVRADVTGDSAEEQKEQGKGRPSLARSLAPWVLYVVFIAGAIALAPRILSWVLDTPYPIATVSGSSMWPTLKKGDLVVLQGVDGVGDLEVGDIISFRHENGLAIHRIVSIDGEKIVTKGDANREADQPIHADQVVGKIPSVGGLLLRVPLVGHLSTFLGPLMGPATDLVRNEPEGQNDLMERQSTPIEEFMGPIPGAGIGDRTGEGERIGPVKDLAKEKGTASQEQGGSPLGSVSDLSGAESDPSARESQGPSVPVEDLSR